MADKEDESNMTTGATEGDGSGGARFHVVAGVTQAMSGVLAPQEAEDESGPGSNCVEVGVKELAETPGISEYLHVSAGGGVHEGAVLGGTCQVVSAFTAGDGLLPGGSIITSFVETPGVETVTTTDFTAVAGELVDTLAPATSTIIYVQPDGSFVEGTGLTPEEQQQLVEQLASQQLVEVTENEAARIFETQQPAPQFPQIPAPPPPPAQYIQHSATLAPEELQQVIEQVAKSQQSAGPPPPPPHSVVSLVQPPPEPAAPEPPATCISLEAGCLFPGGGGGGGGPLELAAGAPPLAIMQNASRQLQHVAKQVALQQSQSQNGTRLIQKKLETIRIQVRSQTLPEPKESPLPPLAVFHPKSVAAGQPVPKLSVTPAVGLGGPQIIHIQPVMGAGAPQQFVLQSSGEPPIQLLVHRQVPARAAPPPRAALNGRAPRPGAPAAPAPTPAPPAPDRKERQREKDKDKDRLRRPQKVKTRSGRISRPPKYKVKDYKFIKREDLADSHQSDSDDYSEISVEEEEAEESKGDAAPINFNLNPKAFKCDTCEKAYIGRGGLSRHYRLNPAHGQMKPPAQAAAAPQGADGAGCEVGPPTGNAGGAPATEPPVHATPTPVPASRAADGTELLPPGPPVAPAEGVDPVGPLSEPVVALQGQKADTPLSVQPAPGPGVPSCAGPGRPRGPGRPKGPGRPGRPKVSGRPARRARPGRPPKYLGGVTTEQQAQRRRARLKEILQQSDTEELMEMALPRLAKVMTVWEFLLMKVEKGRPSRPHFADVYREFEQLHSQVKKMAQEHFGSPLGPGPHTPLEIRDPEVSRSLGIEDLVKKARLQGAASVVQPALRVCKENNLSAGKRLMEHESESSFLPAKRIRIENSAVETNGVYLNQNGIQNIVKEVQLTTGTAQQGTIQAQNEPSALSQGPTVELNGSAVKGALEVDPSSRKALETENGFPVLETRNEPANVLLYQPVEVTLHGSQTEIQKQEELTVSEQAVVFTSLENDFTPEELVEEHLANTVNHEVMEVEPAGGMEGDVQSEQESGTVLLAIPQNDQQGGSAKPSEVLNDSDIADQMHQLEKALSRDVVPLDHSYRTHNAEPRGQHQQTLAPIPASDSLQSEAEGQPEGGLQVMEEKGLTLVESVEQNGSLEHIISVGGTVEFKLSDANQELLSQGHEQIFIQTSEGLIMHHSGGDIASERILIVTDTDGTTMHIRAPEGVPLETVEALLGIETEGQSEGILVSETSQ
ncbi:zinc finger protein 839 isoform X2 [Lepisosteus oculatus]|uniref:zinc finger protein 839 isoform X2 n=1 Tax=Lepisosteus oculatus TaxID=7918 RepID=UPI003716C353